MFKKNLSISYLLDFYKDILPQSQQDMLDLYYNEDLSLSEIAQNKGISRQGVRHSIKRGEQQLIFLEERLGLYKKFSNAQKSYEEIVHLLDFVKEKLQNMQNSDETITALERAVALAALSFK